MRTITTAAVACAALLALTGCDPEEAAKESAGETSTADSKENSKPATTPTPDASKSAAPDDEEEPTVSLGGSISQWATAMAGHGVTWEKEGAKKTISGLPPMLTWVGEHKGATFSSPSFTAEATTDTRRGILSLSCNTAGIPKGEQISLFSDCITAAGLDGVDTAKVTSWVKDKLPAMLNKDGIQVEDLDLDTASIRMDTAGNTAAISIEQ
ncbi:hypothetical protein [Streptomyces corynorhini]|uniref:Lipoprotein n=1 Tax=Streptomyces corynorhini TaxID=2282652 RepID=A0A370B810_9ACTN|nr:hypothetical protein [Streptomyces corynorhini]RDG37947.1 hypothetical protein DVH02_11530 [Streptomyces corynorhini]